MKVAVTGATGFIGRHLVLELNRIGFSVKVLSRDSVSFFPPTVEVINGDLLRLDCPLNLFLQDCDVIFHCAGEIHNELLMNALHVDSTKRMLDMLQSKAFSSSKRIRWIQLSSVGVYGPSLPISSKDRIITENSYANPIGIYEISKYNSDEIVQLAGQSGLIDFCILRPSNVIGCNMTSRYIYEFIRAIHKRLFFYIGHQGAIATYVHVNDVVDALIQCAIKPQAVNQVFNISSDCKLESLVMEISYGLGIAPPKIRIAEAVLRNIEKFLSKFIRTQLTTSRINSLVSRTHYPSDKIIKILDFKFSKPMPISIGEIVSNYLDKR